MTFYRFSPIQNESELQVAIRYVTYQCYALCKKSFGHYFSPAGNLGIFCHDENEYERLTKIRRQLTDESDNILQKYYKLYTPIIVPAKNDIPQTVITYLYIRKPDDNHPQVGDLDFLLPKNEYDDLKKQLLEGKKFGFARIFPRGDLDMIEILDPKVDAAAYIRTKDFEVIKK